jgi:secreted PhoX family phosphatase
MGAAMSVLDDFNRFAFERAKGKYARAQFDQMTHDDWVALVEGYKAEVQHLEGDLAVAKEELEAALDG